MVVDSMPSGPLLSKFSGVFTRQALVSIFLLMNAFVWYSYAIVVLQQNIDLLDLAVLEKMSVWGTHFAALIISALIGAQFSNRFVRRIRLLASWVLVGALGSLSPIFFDAGSVLGVVVLGLIFGFGLGFGVPNCMGYFTSQVSVEKRGRVGGIIILLTGLGTAGLDLIGISSLVGLPITLALWRASALAAVALAKRAPEIQNKIKSPSYRTVIGQKPFVLYFVPWMMFALLSYLTTPVQQEILSPPMFSYLQILENVFMGAFALIGGIFMDSVGRKRLAIVGFVMLGLSYSFLSLFYDPLLKSVPMPIWYAHIAMNGISWGILYVLFVVTIWGDLSHEMPSDKFYALGVVPFFASKMLQLTIGSQIVAAGIEVSEIFTFVALFLFMAVLPLVYVPETLPEKVMKERELKTYLEKAKEIVAKAQKKDEEEHEEGQDSVKFEVPQECDEEAEELAQKYY